VSLELNPSMLLLLSNQPAGYFGSRWCSQSGSKHLVRQYPHSPQRWSSTNWEPLPYSILQHTTSTCSA